MTFEQAYNSAVESGKKLSVLLGNGFSMGYDPNRFSFTNLLESAKQHNIIPRDSNLLRIFESLQTADFEKVIKTLEDGKLVAQIYGAPFNIKNVEHDIKALKKHLVNTVTNNHPDKSTDVPVTKSKNCSDFLDKFYKIYTLNYDLLSYWVILQNDLTKFTDGFATSVDDPDADYVVFTENDHNLLFLHGGLHIFDKKTETIKLTFCRTNETLKAQIYRYLLNDTYPVFISEGASESKLEKIRHNYYLNRCYKSLRSQPGTLFILGTALKSNDDHIRKAITHGKFDTLYIGVWSDAEQALAEVLKDEFEAAGTEQKPKQAFLYDAKTAKPWG